MSYKYFLLLASSQGENVVIALALKRLFNAEYWSAKVNLCDILKHKWYKLLSTVEI